MSFHVKNIYITYKTDLGDVFVKLHEGESHRDEFVIKPGNVGVYSLDYLNRLKYDLDDIVKKLIAKDYKERLIRADIEADNIFARLPKSNETSQFLEKNNLSEMASTYNHNDFLVTLKNNISFVKGCIRKKTNPNFVIENLKFYATHATNGSIFA